MAKGFGLHFVVQLTYYQIARALCSSKSGEKLTSFDQYISRMKPNQTDIYFIAGQDRKQLEKSPYLEKLLQKDFEVGVSLFP